MNGTVLVVDDILDNLRVLLNFLSDAGLEVLIAQSGESGIERARYAKPDLILLDVLIPDINGFEVCKVLKMYSETQYIPIVFMTALADTTSKIRGLELGAADYITKPIQHKEVLARVNTHLSLYRLQKQLSQQNVQLQVEIKTRQSAEKQLVEQNYKLQEEINTHRQIQHYLEKTKRDLMAKNIELQEEIEFRKEIQQSLQSNNDSLHQEIDSRRQVQRSLQKTNTLLSEKTTELERRNQELDIFTRTIGHDLKSPLGGIISLTKFLANQGFKNGLDYKSLKHIRLIQQSSQKMLDAVSTLLLLVSISRKASITLDTIDMVTLIEQVLETHQPLIEEYQANITYPPNLPTVNSCITWIETVWNNYLTNGLKYGGKPPKLTIGADKAQAGKIRFWIKDNGEGLSVEEQRKLFTPFIRLNKASNGHGLGLSIVKKAIEGLDGEVGVESQKGAGSTFYFTLPSISPDT